MTRQPNRSDDRRRSRVVVLAVALALVLAGAVAAWQLFGGLLVSKDYESPGSGSVTVVVEPQDTGRRIGRRLQQAGVVKTAKAFTSALSEQPGDAIQPGRYTLRQQMAAADALSRMRQGRDVLRVVVPEGLWKSEVYALLSTRSGRPVADYVAVEKRAAADPELLGLPDAANGNPEGYLFPATYDFEPTSTPQQQLREMVGHATSRLRELGAAPEQMERTVTIASLVEAEAKLPADRPKVARVIENRLAADRKLELDSTVNYGIQRKSIATTDAARATRNGYNTYAMTGLPVGPIGSPGAASIEAVKNPADGPWMFFVTVDPTSGRTLFATTAPEHFANVKQFQRWCQARPGTC